MLTRRAFLRLFGSAAFAGAGLTSYGVLVEPFWRLHVQHYSFTPAAWPKDFPLRVAIVADLHACDPWMSEARVDNIVSLTNDLGADCILLLGDYIATHRFQRNMPADRWAKALARLRAPLGVHSVLGNHDWWSDRPAMARGGGLPFAGQALLDAGVPVYENKAVRLAKDGRPFWIAGLGDQIAFIPLRGWQHPQFGVDDLKGTLAQVSDDAPVILMAHEPDVFPKVSERVALTVCGHTHGGQITFFGRPLVVPSAYGARYAYGHKVENNQHVLISGGLGCSGLPVRFGSPPEVVVIDLGGTSAA